MDKVNNSGSLGQPSPSSSDSKTGEEFTSITDILFTNKMYYAKDRTVNVGSSGSNPVSTLNSDHVNSKRESIHWYEHNFLRTLNEGVYFGYDGGTPKLSLKGGAHLMDSLHGMVVI